MKPELPIEARDELLATLCKLSDQQFDDSLKPRLRAIMGRPNAEIKDELLGIIDDCTYCSLCSAFEIKALHYIWIGCGGTEQELAERNRSLVATAEQQKKYKWQGIPVEAI